MNKMNVFKSVFRNRSESTLSEMKCFWGAYCSHAVLTMACGSVQREELLSTSFIFVVTIVFPLFP